MIYYRHDNDRLEIIRILHGRQDAAGICDRRRRVGFHPTMPRQKVG